MSQATLNTSGNGAGGPCGEYGVNPSGATVWACPNQMNQEQGVQRNDNRTRGEKERESVLGIGLRWAKRGKKKN